MSDGNYTGWGVNAGLWTAADGTLRSTNNNTALVYRGQTAADFQLRLKFRRESAGGIGTVHLRYTTSPNRLQLSLRADRVELVERINDVAAVRGSNAGFPTARDTWYELVVRCAGNTATRCLGGYPYHPGGGQVPPLDRTPRATVALLHYARSLAGTPRRVGPHAWLWTTLYRS